jgi:hypothetical protein
MSGAMINCPACGAETFLRREPLYEGFRRVGETLSCVGCGHRFASEADVPFVRAEKPQVFSEADLSRKVTIFHSDEVGHNCRYCRHYVKNPFVQRCGWHQVEVQATDCCPDFAKKTDADDAGEDALSRLLRAKE